MSRYVEIPVAPIYHNKDPKCAVSGGDLCPFLCAVPITNPPRMYCSAITSGAKGDFHYITTDGKEGLEPHLSCPIHYETERDAMRRKIEAAEG